MASAGRSHNRAEAFKIIRANITLNAHTKFTCTLPQVEVPNQIHTNLMAQAQKVRLHTHSAARTRVDYLSLLMRCQRINLHACVRVRAALARACALTRRAFAAHASGHSCTHTVCTCARLGSVINSMGARSHNKCPQKTRVALRRRLQREAYD